MIQNYIIIYLIGLLILVFIDNRRLKKMDKFHRQYVKYIEQRNRNYQRQLDNALNPLSEDSIVGRGISKYFDVDAFDDMRDANEINDMRESAFELIDEQDDFEILLHNDRVAHDERQDLHDEMEFEFKPRKGKK